MHNKRRGGAAEAKIIRKLDRVRFESFNKGFGREVPCATSQADAAPNLVTSPEILPRSSYPIAILLAILEPADKNPRERAQIQSK